MGSRPTRDCPVFHSPRALLIPNSTSWGFGVPGIPPFISWEELQLPSLARWVLGPGFMDLLSCLPSFLPSLSQVILLLRDFPLPLREHLELALGHLQPPKEGDLQALEQKPQDLFHVLLQSQEQPCPWRHLLAASVKHQAPVLSVLAACSQVPPGWASALLGRQRGEGGDSGIAQELRVGHRLAVIVCTLTY